MAGCMGQGIVFDWAELEKQRDEEFQRQLADLKSKNKSLSDLIFDKKFFVKAVIGENYSTSFTPQSEVMIGGRSLVYNAGFVSRLSLQVKDYDLENKTGIETIVFNGDLPVLAGNVILAKIPIYERKVLENPNQWSSDKPVFYLDRACNNIELAIELSLVTDSREIIRVQRGVDYSRYQDHIK